MSGWDAALDGFAASLTAQREALREHRRPPRPFRLSTLGLGPLPPRLAARAAELLAGSRELEALLHKAMREAAQRGALASRLRAGYDDGRGPHRCDRRG